MPRREGETTNEATRPIEGRRFARNLDWNLLRTFHEIVAAQGVVPAAQTLGRGQPAVSMALKRLEETLGVQLCHRGPGGFALTREGEMIADMCAGMFTTVARMPGDLAAVMDEVRGRVRLQIISNLASAELDDALERFHRDHGGVELYVSVSTYNVIKRNLLANEVDLGVSIVRERDPHLRYELLFREHYRPYCGRSHPLYGTFVDDPADLGGCGFVLTGADEPDQLRRFRHRHQLGRRVVGMSEQLEEARRLVKLGVGICFLPEALAAGDVVNGTLHPLLAPADEPGSDIHLVYSPNAPKHGLRDALMDCIRASFARKFI